MMDDKTKRTVMKPDVWLPTNFPAQTDQRVNGWLYRCIAAQRVKRPYGHLTGWTNHQTLMRVTVKTERQANNRTDSGAIIRITVKNDGSINIRPVRYVTGRPINQSFRKIIN